MDLAAERVESLKAGILGGMVAAIALLMIAIIHSLLQRQFLIELHELVSQFNLQAAVRVGIGSLTGFLFGVTYRYIVRQDDNPQLKAGGIMAFGLIRGLAQVEVAFDPAKITNLSVLVVENLFLFAFIALVLSWAIDRGWIRAFNTF